LKRILQSIFPAPRRRVTVWTVLPLVIFLAAYGGVCFWLDWQGVMLFATPAWFALMTAAPWIWWMHVAGFGGLSGGRSVAALVTRLSLLGAFAMLMAEPRAVRTNHTLSVVFAVDVSDSIDDEALKRALSFVTATIAEKGEKDEVGLLVFGKNAAVELPPRLSFPFEGFINSRILKDGTNLEKALALGAAMLPEENQGRIVLISDGVPTEGTHTRVLDELKSRGIAVDVVPVEYAYEHEVWLEKLELPRFVKSGETYEASVILSSLQSGSGLLVVRENGREIYKGAVNYAAGKNKFTLPIYMRQAGFYEYEATIEAPKGKDGRSENNIAINYLFLKGKGKVLVATDPAGDPRDYTDFVKALRAADREVEVAPSYEFPRDALSLMPYDCIVFVNVPADAFDIVQLNAVKEAVYNQGIGFLMVGGKNSFGPGGYHRTAIEETLPVAMDVTQKKVLPKGALVIILHTCEFPEGNTWGRRIAQRAVEVLGAQDEVGLLDYELGGEKWVFPLTPAAEFQRLAVLIQRADPGDMPSFQRIMQMGLDGLKASDAAMKHMIIISDGDPSPPTPALINDFKQAKVSITGVAIFPHDGQDPIVMQAMARETGGRYYHPRDPNQLPAIFVKEAKTLKRDMIQNKTIVPVVDFPSPILKGITTIPELKAYVLTSPKARSFTVLKTPEKEEVEPILSTWKFGVGSAAASMSDLSYNWASAWMQWEHYQAFVRQLITDISRVDKPTNLQMQCFAAGGDGVVLIEDYSTTNDFLEIEALVNGPHERTETLRFRQVAPKRYQAQFPLWGKGRYSIAAIGAAGERKEQTIGGFVVPYSPEYQRFRAAPILLEEVAERTGGRNLLGKDTAAAAQEIFKARREPKRTSKPILDWFFIALAILLPLDVGVRRVQLDWRVIRGWLRFGREEAASTETLGTLLKRKKEIVFDASEKKQERPLVTTPTTFKPSGTTPRPSATPKPSPAPSKTEPSAEVDEKNLSTTERLLRAKKKRGTDQK
jgi:uncharacterized membrane protein/Mg-chelatase subunit ChlD